MDSLQRFLKRQESDRTLNVRADDMKVDGVAKLQLSLDVTDRRRLGRNLPMKNLRYNLVMNPCARFYEKQTGLAYLERDLLYDRAAQVVGQDFTFEFGLRDCASQFYADVD